ncbi:MAG: DUF2125 domain-containing protein [Devosia sp.]
MKRIIILGAVVGIVVVVYSGAWFWAAGQIGAYEKTLEAADGVTALKLACGSFGVGGFPFGFDLTCAKATVTLADTTITISGLKASAEVYNPTHVLVFAQSPIGIVDAFTGSQSRVDFDSAQASARLNGWRIGRISLIVEKPVWNDSVLEDRLIAKADHAEAHLIDLPAEYDAKTGLAGLGEYVKIDNIDAPGFEIAAGKTTFEGEFTKVPDDVRTYGDADIVKRWQAAGGVFKLIAFKGEDSDSHFEATGNLQVDTQGRINGQLKLSSKGVVERLGPMIPEQYRGLILGGQADDGSYSQTINIAAGVVFSGIMPAGMIPPVF